MFCGNKFNYREHRSSTDCFVSDKESDEYKCFSDDSNESHGKFLRKLYQSTHADVLDVITPTFGEIDDEQDTSNSYNTSEKRNLSPEKINFVGSDAMNDRLQSVNTYQGISDELNRSLMQLEFDLLGLNLSFTSPKTAGTPNFPVKEEFLDSICPSKCLVNARETLLKEIIDPHGVHQKCHCFSDIKNTETTVISETPRTSKTRFKRAHTSHPSICSDNSDSSTDEQSRTESSKRRKPRKRRKGILFQSSDEDIRRSNSDLFESESVEDWVSKESKDLNAYSACISDHNEKVMKNIIFGNLNGDIESNQTSIENLNRNIKATRVSRKRLVSHDEIFSPNKINKKKCITNSYKANH